MTKTDFQNKENHSTNGDFNPKVVVLKKDFPVHSTVSDQMKIKEEKHRPKSATGQQIKKEQIKHSKLGPNASVKP